MRPARFSSQRVSRSRSRTGPALAADTLKLAIGQRGLWDSAIAEIGTQAGIFAKHGLELQVFYTSGGGETQQAVISGSADIGVSPGTLGVLGAFAKGAPIRIIAGEATGTAEYYFVRADSPVQKDFKGVKPEMTLAYSTNGSGTHITALRFMKDYGFQAKLVATGNVPATFTSGDVGPGRHRLLDPAVRSRCAGRGQEPPDRARQRPAERAQSDRARDDRECRSTSPGGARSTTASSRPIARRSTGCIPTRARSRPSPDMPRSRRQRRRTCATSSIRRAMLQLDRVEGIAGADAGRDRVQIHPGGAEPAAARRAAAAAEIVRTSSLPRIVAAAARARPDRLARPGRHAPRWRSPPRGRRRTRCRGSGPG